MHLRESADTESMLKDIRQEILFRFTDQEISRDNGSGGRSDVFLVISINYHYALCLRSSNNGESSHVTIPRMWIADCGMFEVVT